MAQRRVSAQGFGGGSPVLGILRGVAEGRLQREEIDRQNRRSAILNRLSNAQIEQMRQGMRLRQEEADRTAEELRRERERTQAAMENLKGFGMDEFNMTAEEAENWAEAKLQGLPTAMDVAQQRANLSQTEASTAANRASTEARRLQTREMKVAQAARELLAEPRFTKLLASPDISASTKAQIIRQQAPSLMQSGMIAELDEELLGEAASQAAQVATRQSFTPDEATRQAQELLGAFDDNFDRARQQVQTMIQNNPNLSDQGNRVLDALDRLENRGGGDGLNIEGARRRASEAAGGS